MSRDPMARRRQMRFAVAVLAVGILASALVSLALLRMAGLHTGS